jgi:hypothetical protein
MAAQEQCSSRRRRCRCHMGGSDPLHTLLRAHSFMTWRHNHNSTRRADDVKVASAPAQRCQHGTSKVHTARLLLGHTCSVLRKNMKKTGETCMYTAGWGLGCRWGAGLLMHLETCSAEGSRLLPAHLMFTVVLPHSAASTMSH